MTSSSHAPVRIGVLFSETGVTSVIENSQRIGTLLAAGEINAQGGINGREIVLQSYDPQSRPALYRQLAERLITEDGIRVIAGCYMSSTRKALIPVLERWNALLLYPTLYEGFEYSRNVFYTGAAPNQNSLQLAEYMTRKFGPRVFMVGSDYVYPYESNRIMSDLVLERGGEKLAEQYKNDPQRLTAWQAGLTGMPIVDAAMRQLVESGWMHNRPRMIVASYLVKDLICDWRLGERFFMEHLVDGDLAANNGGWQWSASSGMDPKPLRIFNPATQAAKFDPEATYIRTWLPELAHVATADLISGQIAPLERRGYPAPIVDHRQQQARFKAIYAALPRG